ncbi:MAG: 23S rRNA (adenine(2503)-C(2))-methyltransferase RlmN [Phycisphaera sp.]|nr:23S rRNA (adenine(2503)-C(2))-methyltransferase RlmN [Phycisphaera sp.]
MSQRPHFFDLDKTQLEQLVQSWGWPRFRAGQLIKWVYERGVTDPEQMTDLSKRDRADLAEKLTFTRWNVVQHQHATDDTQKLLLEDRDAPTNAGKPKSQTECVMIPAESPTGKSRRTACISSQVGCPVGCRFCASGLGGLEANLTAGQIVEQVWWLERATGERISNIVFMGMGEPLNNFANVLRAVRTLNADWAFDIGARKITISTVGVPAQIRRLADQIDAPVTLAISLHAPNDDVRRQLIPWAEYTTIDALAEAARYYFDKTGREVTLEYILLRDVNDRPEHASQLADVCKRMRCNVNLIRYNEVRGLPYGRPDNADVHQFQETLRNRGVNVHIRASRGRDIAAACGQLRHEAKAAAG